MNLDFLSKRKAMAVALGLVKKMLKEEEVRKKGEKYMMAVMRSWLHNLNLWVLLSLIPW